MSLEEFLSECERDHNADAQFTKADRAKLLAIIRVQAEILGELFETPHEHLLHKAVEQTEELLNGK